MAAASVSMVLNQLGAFLREEIEKEVIMVVGVKEDIEKLRSTLIAIQAVLHDADRKQVQDQRVKVWLERLKEVVYEVEDILDNWNTKIIQSKIKKYSESSSEKVCSHLFYPCFCFKNSVLLRHTVGRKIKRIREKLDSIASDKNNYGLANDIDDATTSLNRGQLIAFPSLIHLVIWWMSELEEWVLPFERSDKLRIMPRLRILQIGWAPNLKALPAFGRLESLEELRISSLDLVKHIGPEFFGISEDDVMKGTSGSSRGGESLPIIVFPKLKKLQIHYLKEWEEWEMMMPSLREDVSFVMPYLEQLELSNCFKLKVVPHNIFSYQPVKERLKNCMHLIQRSNHQIVRREVGESYNRRMDYSDDDDFTDQPTPLRGELIICVLILNHYLLEDDKSKSI
ncbi:hypothetical protein GIB67_028761 [Kingdonia uniflora]|uniref:Disease resistance N-terminal domain-containing protein n=1 Tax=Kingdonia uniflora TaxID=39325 RepID=A0A7J7NQ71_9MAGN|nr:hypothetical protein GIB67_028761 [Kingdonia uniflora]